MTENNESMHLSYSQLVTVLNEQAARIAELEAQSGEAWQPVEDGEYISDKSYVQMLAGHYCITVATVIDDNGQERWNGMILPDGYRLCRRADAPQSAGKLSRATPKLHPWYKEEGL